uniref:Uncharacterized protein n=1 Tax=Romanomermis culicivorax TaxID=13658 RepID=A0A915J8V5_ROMCU
MSIGGAQKDVHANKERPAYTGAVFRLVDCSSWTNKLRKRISAYDATYYTQEWRSLYKPFFFIKHNTTNITCTTSYRGMSPWDRRRRRKRNHKRPRMNNRRNSSRDHQNNRSSGHREDQKSSTDRQKSQSSSCRQSDQKSSRDRQKSQSSSRGKDDEKSSHERRCDGGSSRHFSNASNTLSRLSNNSSTKSATKNVRLKLTKRRPIYSHSKKSLQASMETSNADDGDASSSRRRLEKKPHKSMRSTGIFTTGNFGAATARAGRVPEPSALFDQLKRAVTDDRIRIVRSRIQHIWDRHG